MSFLNVLLEHVWMFINANPKYLCRSDIFVFNTHTCIWTCSLSMYRLFVFQSLAESWIVSTNYLKQECLAMNGEWANFLEKKERSCFSWGQDKFIDKRNFWTLFQWEYEVLKS